MDINDLVKITASIFDGDLDEFLLLQMSCKNFPQILSNVKKIDGGYVGEKLSKNSPDIVWKTLLKMGVRQIIDLRYGYNSETFRSRCETYGIRYYSYPIHNDPETIANIVEKFDEFSQLLKEGHFYMQGPNTSYVALGIHWVLSCSIGLYSMEFKDEVKRNPLVIKRMMPIVDAIIRYKEERSEDVAGMKGSVSILRVIAEVFKDRVADKCILFPVQGGVMGDLIQTKDLERRIDMFHHFGIKTIIDVRYPGNEAEELSSICHKKNVEYFYYPFDRCSEYYHPIDDDMVRLFPRFCELLEAGGYYLCGRNEAILSLLVYWIFYGADRGVKLSQLFGTKDFSRVFPDDTRSMHGDLSRIIDGMQKRFGEFNQTPLTREVLSIRKTKVWQNNLVAPHWAEGSYSFLKVSEGHKYGRYFVSIKDDSVGWIEEPNRICNDWQYCFVYQGETISGQASSFPEAKKKLFDYIYNHTSPEEYLRLMNFGHKQPI